MKKIALLILTITIITSCKQKGNNEQNSDVTKNSSTENSVIEEKHKDEKLYKGMFSYVAKTNEVSFYECNQKFTISVVPLKDSDFNSLFDAYKRVQEDKVLDYAYVEFNGYITDKIVASEMDDVRTIRIVKFLNIDKNKSCD